MRIYLYLIISFFLTACDNNKETATVEKDLTPEYQTYVLTGDLNKINTQGELRLLAREFDHLQHSGLNEQVFPMNKEQAEAFAISLHLKPVWIYGDSSEDLINMLEQGEGDLIVSNLTQTISRERRIDFSHALDIVDEVIIQRSDVNVIDVSHAELQLAVIAHSSYTETAENLLANNPSLEIQTVPAQISNFDLFTAVDEGLYQATIIDKNIAESLLNGWSTLKIGQTVAKNRLLAWGVRKSNPELKRKLNQYLLSHSILSSRHKVVFQDFTEIKKQKKLRVITLNSPASYFMRRGEFKGFDYELMQHFAKKHNLRLQMIVRDSPEAMIASLMRGEGDIIAGSLSIDKKRAEAGLVFSKWYLKVSQQLIGSAGETPMTDIEDLNGKTVTVNPASSFFQTLTKIQQQGIDVNINTQKGYNSAQLQESVNRGEFKYTIVDSHLATLESQYLDNTQVLITLGETSHLAWGLRKEQPVLKQKLNQFIKQHYKSLHYNLSFNKYFVKQEHTQHTQTGRIQYNGKLSPFDKLFQKYANIYDHDWRMIASQSYQESRYNPKATSYAGAIGLMQVMPRTGKSMGYSNLYNPEENIAAAMKFMHWLEDRFPANLPLQEKIYFTLAAYNAGHGHVHDARRLAKKMGKNPNLWFNNVENAMLLLSQPKYYRHARYGYVRGSEPVKYVREISNRYLGYVKAREQ